ncbi:hypothetical protein [Burkholderia gladioli]|uniref:hypothetical protein n=1 Tax=Burkholderia gladioli TaxID=28095 RepID=UPI00163E2291|nr:hypothetical protein [Burkholderia gladioli]
MGSFKRWFTVAQAASVLRESFGEDITEADVLDRAYTGEIAVWWDATERYAVPIARASHAFGLRPNQAFGEQGLGLSPARREFWSQLSGHVRLLDGFYRIAFNARQERREIFDGSQSGRIVYADGILLFDVDGQSLLQVLQRMPFRSAGSSNTRDFIVDLELPAPNAFRIRSADLQKVMQLDDEDEAESNAAYLGDGERASLQKQIGSLALALAAASNRYAKSGGYPNPAKIAEAVGEILDSLPDDVKRQGTGSSSLRASIKAGLTLLNGT